MSRPIVSDEAFIERARIVSARLVAIYLLHQSRNEWTNWSGETDNIRRPVGSVSGGIEEAYEAAEKNRAPGTVFGMQDSVGIELNCDLGILLLSEQFTDSPFDHCLKTLDSGGNLEALSSVIQQLPERRFIGKTCLVGSERSPFREFSATTPLFKRSARAGGRQNGLGWSAKPYYPKLNDAEKIVTLINGSLFASGAVSEGGAGNGESVTTAWGVGAMPTRQRPANEAEVALAEPLPEVPSIEAAELGDTQPRGLSADFTPDKPLLSLEQSIAPPPLSIEATVREQLTYARIGQGIYRKRLEEIETCCRVTGLSELAHLRASHIKPWRACADAEKLDGNNGLLLSPHVDHLFDQGYISFSDNGDCLISTSLKPSVLAQWKLAEKFNVGTFNAAQRSYLAYHRQNIFRRE